MTIESSEFTAAPHMGRPNPHHQEVSEIAKHIDRLTESKSWSGTKRAHDLIDGHIKSSHEELVKASSDTMEYYGEKSAAAAKATARLLEHKEGGLGWTVRFAQGMLDAEDATAGLLDDMSPSTGIIDDDVTREARAMIEAIDQALQLLNSRKSIIDMKLSGDMRSDRRPLAAKHRPLRSQIATSKPVGAQKLYSR